MLENDFKKLDNWKINEDSIEKKFVFKNFQQAIDFIVEISKHAEKLNHHPEIYSVYNKVNLKLTTHDIGGLTELDLELAKLIDLTSS